MIIECLIYLLLAAQIIHTEKQIEKKWKTLFLLLQKTIQMMRKNYGIISIP